MSEETDRLAAKADFFNAGYCGTRRDKQTLTVTEAEFLGNAPRVQEAVTRTLTAVADIGTHLRIEPRTRSAAEVEREKQLADFASIDFGRPSVLGHLVKKHQERVHERERQELAGQAAADMRLAAEAQVEKARHGLASGVPAMEVAAVVAAAFTSLVEAHTYEQAAAHERTREHTRTNEGESHDEA